MQPHPLWRVPQATRRFNPHPARRPDATCTCARWRPPRPCSFNPHPARRPDATRSCGLVEPRPRCFNPHPARRPDATGVYSWGVFRVHQSFNPHPARRPDATIQHRQQLRVSSSFNPHPARRPDATRVRLRSTMETSGFQSSSGQKAGCNLPCGPAPTTAADRFQSSSGQKAGCNALRVRVVPVSVIVSILIRPEGRMQQRALRATPRAAPVSILIRPEGRMQHSVVFNYSNVHRFQSSSGQKAGCNRSFRRPFLQQHLSFNPHPARRPDATAMSAATRSVCAMFQSSSGQKAGCNPRV